MAGNVLLIDANPRIRQQVAKACSELNASLSVIERAEEVFEVIKTSSPDLVVLDVRRDEPDTFTLFEELRRRRPRLCAMIIAQPAGSEQAIEAMKRGAIDYLITPLKHAELVKRINNALRISHDMTVPTVYEHDQRDEPTDRIIGQSPAMQEVFKLIGLIAPQDVNVLITGESGTGKELVAKALYHHSKRKDRAYLAINCAAIPETLLESELFGHEKGSFTGADVRRIGKFEQCAGGTLFLDEIGDIPLPTQAKLLRVLQDGSFQRLGGLETIRCDVRIIASTNQPLEQLITERKFRQDLYYRLKVASIKLPPLRDRDVDPVLLAHYFVQRFSAPMGKHIQKFSPEVLPALLTYPWPGNVRELENAIKASLVVARGTVFQIGFLPGKIRKARPSPDEESDSPPPATAPIGGTSQLRDACRQLLGHKQFHGQLYKQAVEAAEREVITACLEQANGHLAPAARLLGITRTTLRKKMAALGIQITKSITSKLDQ